MWLNFWKKGEISLKKVLKNVSICILIVYFVISLGYAIIEKGVLEEEISILNSRKTSSDEMYNVTYDAKDIENLSAKVMIINNNLKIVVFSIIIGGMIGLVISVKENSKVKYILYFILGELIFNSIWTVIMVMIYCKNGIDIEYIYHRLSNIYYEMFIKFFLLYVLIYISIVAINIANNRRKVQQLNERLLGEKEVPIEDKKKKERIRKVAIIVVVGAILIISVYSINIVRKTIILTNYSNAIFKFNNLNNYYYKEQRTYNEKGEEPIYSENGIYEIYCKDGIYLTKLNHDVIRYENALNDENISINRVGNVAYVSNKVSTNKINNLYYGDNNIRKWRNFLLAFQVKVDSDTFNDKKCYVIKRNNTTLYIDKETCLPVKEITNNTYTSTKGKSQFETITECSYSRNVVTDQDVTKPDLTGYETTIIDNKIYSREN